MLSKTCDHLKTNACNRDLLVSLWTLKRIYSRGGKNHVRFVLSKNVQYSVITFRGLRRYLRQRVWRLRYVYFFVYVGFGFIGW